MLPAGRGTGDDLKTNMGTPGKKGKVQKSVCLKLLAEELPDRRHTVHIQPQSEDMRAECKETC